MTYKGKIKNGVVVLESGASLPEGAEVVVESAAEHDEYASLREGLLQFAGVVKDRPSDIAYNHDHYIHGTPKK